MAMGRLGKAEGARAAVAVAGPPAADTGAGSGAEGDTPAGAGRVGGRTDKSRARTPAGRERGVHGTNG